MNLVDFVRKAVDRLEGMRKLFLCVLLAVVAGIPLLIAGFINGAEWSGVATTAIASYCGANIAEKGVAAVQEYLAKK